MNNVSLLGRLCDDPKITPGELTRANFTLAVNRPKKKDKEQECDFVPCVAFGKRAETIGDYVSKGQRLLIEGSLNVNNYTDKSGNKKTFTSVIVRGFWFIEKAEKSDRKAEPDTPMSTFGQGEGETNRPSPKFVPDDEIPF